MSVPLRNVLDTLLLSTVPLNKFKRKKRYQGSMVYELFGHTDLKMLKQKIQTKHLYAKMYFFGLKILKKMILRAAQIYTEREGVQKISARS